MLKKERKEDDKILFYFIQNFGENKWQETFCTVVTTSNYNRKQGETHYRVFLKGGISFDISEQRDISVEGWYYFFMPQWSGAYECDTATDALAILGLLGHSEEIEKLRQVLSGEMAVL